MKITIAALAFAVSLPLLASADPVPVEGILAASRNGTGATGQAALPIPALPSETYSDVTVLKAKKTSHAESSTATKTSARQKDVFGSPVR